MSDDHDNHASHDAADGHDAHPVATDVIPESSPQDLILKLITIVAAVLIWGSFGWWWAQPLSAVSESGSATEGAQH